MLFLLAAFAIGALLAPAIMRRGRLGYVILSVIPLVSFVILAAQGRQVLSGDFPAESWAWVPQLSLNLTFRLDHLSWVMSLIVTGVGAAVLFYCARYFSAAAQGMGRFAGVFVAFAGAMLGLVTTDNTLALYLFWELTSVFSFLLIGFNYEKRASRRAAGQAFIVTTLGGLAMLVGIITMGNIPGGSYSITELIEAANAGTLGVAPIAAESVPSAVIPVATVLILLGALAKSAIIPFHFWLPAAMAAPTPTSAYLHAAAMVKAGVYLVARLAPGFADVPAWRWMILIGGMGTLLLGGFRALKQYDLKLVLAFGTVSQLGLILLMVGYGTSAMLLAGLGMLVAHSMFKSTLFLAVGQVDWATGTRDLRELSGLGRLMPITATAAGLAGLSMMGFPGFAGFVAKEAALHALIGGDAVDTLTWITIAIGSALTAAYTLRFWWGAFADKPGVTNVKIKKRSWMMTLPVIVLSLGGLVFGIGAHLLDAVLRPHAEQIPGDPGHLVAWPGFGTPFLVTIAIIVAGVAIFAARGPFERVFGSRQFPIAADATYQKSLDGLDWLSGRATAFTQRGSLPFYLSTIFTFTVVMILLALTIGEVTNLPKVRGYDSVAQLLVVIVTMLAAFLAARARHRLKAVLLMGISGYGVALTYELYGAPDLAVTQALVETMSLVVFILVLRRLPQYFSNRPLRFSRWWRIALAALFGAMVAFLGVYAAGARVHEPISLLFNDEAYNYGYGKNIVNVTLVDIRAWDTMGEISVVVAAAIGISSLLFIRDRGGRIDRFRNLQTPVTNVAGQVLRPTHDVDGPAWRRTRTRVIESSVISPGRNRRWLEGTDQMPFWRRSVILEVGTRLTFHTILVVSVFFLFSGHNAPGGGFAGGLLAGIALVLRYVAGGRYELGAAIPLHPGHLMGAGLAVAGISAFTPVLLGGTILQSAKITVTLWGFGEVKIATAVFFDIGVYLVVVGLILDILRSLGAEIDRHGEIEGLDDDSYDITPSADTRRDTKDAQEAIHFDTQEKNEQIHGKKRAGQMTQEMAAVGVLEADNTAARHESGPAKSVPVRRSSAERAEDDSGERVDPRTGLRTVASDPSTTSTTTGSIPRITDEEENK
ncbi:Na+/H+ antiporter subunit A [Trueperella bialowiezensis]|uniref:Multiple resistance and pH homeostasis protein A n=1 Tax=Trueperella bialowiezensis TaxID=312285 RepID=A0A448PF10_9ACTO|nr:Na+/H+ antiporter subunit A [Trueperella bialowiezensis]VEI13529.1 Multiple resistance and pH homeostasis protein A [Trueperella bialowiezensis]